jgi:hypothetical protein
MDGGETFATFQFNADATTYARARSRKYPEVAFLVEYDFGSGVMTSCTKRFLAGKAVKS